MDTQNVGISSEVFDWNEGMVHENLPKALELLKAKCDCDEDATNTYRTVTFALRSCVRIVPLADLEECLFSFICPAMKSFYCNIIKSLKKTSDITGLTQTQCDSTEAINYLLSLCAELLNSLISVMEYLLTYEKIPLQYCESFCCACEQILFDSLEFCQERDEKIMQASFDLINLNMCELNVYFTKLLNGLEINTNTDENNDKLAGFINCIAKGSIFVLNLSDMKIVTDSWKGLIVLAEKYQGIGQLIYVDEILDSLLKHVDKLVENLMASDNLAVCIKSTDILKLCLFYLKIAIKIADLFLNVIDAALPSVVDTLINLFKYTPSFLLSKRLDNNSVAEITKAVAIPAEVLLGKTFSNKTFAQYILNLDFKSNIYGQIILICSLLKKLNQESIPLYISSTKNILEIPFDLIESDSCKILNDEFKAAGSIVTGQPPKYLDLYETIFHCTAALIAKASDPYLIRKIQLVLMSNLLQEHPWRALLASDLCCFIARYKEAAVCHSVITTIIPLFGLFDVSCSRPELLYMSKLVQRLLPLCESSYVNKLMKIYPVEQHCQMWVHLGLPQTAYEHVPSLVNSANVMYRNLFLRPTVTDFITLINCVKILAVTSSSHRQDLFNSLWSIKIDSYMLETKTGQLFLKVLLQYTEAFLKTAENSLIDCLFILYQLKEFILAPVSLKLSVLSVLKCFNALKLSECSEKNVAILQLSELFATFLNFNDVIVQEFALHVFASFSRKTAHPEIISSVAQMVKVGDEIAAVLQKKLKQQRVDCDFFTDVRLNHVCGKNSYDTFEEEIYENKSKRMKIGSPGAEHCDQLIVDDAIVELEKRVDALFTLRSRLSEANRLRILNVLQKLQNL